MLVEAGLISPQQLEAALAISKTQNKRVGQVLLEQKLVAPSVLATTLSYQLNVPIVDLKKYPVKQEALRLIPEEMARRHKVLPLAIEDGALLVATAEPQAVMTLEEIRARAKMRVKPLLSMETDIEEALNRHYRATVEIEQQIRQIAPTLEVGEERVSPELIAHSPVVRAVDLIISQAVKDRASDIHLEPRKEGVRVRYRIDGILHDSMSLPAGVHAAIVSRIKVMAGMNIAERRRPQDGQFSVKVGESDIDVRAATIETSNGEMVALRILDKSLSILDLGELGLQAEALELYRKMLRAPFGTIIICGPTGAGKTTTLYASVNQLDRDENNIITIEDPIEYHFTAINQIQVNRQAGITFASGLRSIMRLDPDIILVGEIRDQETAEIAIQAALTGHLVLSSVHANDAVGSLFRLMDLGVEPLLLASALVGTVSQRLVRRACPHCKTTYEATEEEVLAYQREIGEERREFYRGAGCNFCAQTGYLGRTAVFEVLSLTEELRRMIIHRASNAEVRTQALRDGMIAMQRDGMLKARDSTTTPYEVLRNVFVLG